MRAFTLALALSFPFALGACNAEPEQSEAVEDYEEATEGPIEEELDQELTGYSTYDTDNDGLFSEDEYNVGIGDDRFGEFDADGDGFLNEEEYVVYESEAMEM